MSYWWSLWVGRHALILRLLDFGRDRGRVGILGLDTDIASFHMHLLRYSDLSALTVCKNS